MPKKLGIKEGHSVWLAGAPPGFERTLGALPPDARIVRSPRGSAKFDVIVLFARTAAELARGFGKSQRSLVENGGLWVAWPKQSSGMETDLVESTVRAHGLSKGLVDNKVCAIDATWSGLRFVVRLRDRKST